MTISILRDAIAHTAEHFTLAEPRVARRQAKKLIRARIYLVEHCISAVAIGSEFKYERATGSVLGTQHV